jgi:hypothetical protein
MAPLVRRFLELTITPRGNSGFLVASTTIRSERCPAVALLASDRPHSEAPLSVCGWCRRVDLGSRWCEAEEALSVLRLFEHDLLPLVTHGMCEACYDRVNAMLDR